MSIKVEIYPKGQYWEVLVGRRVVARIPVLASGPSAKFRAERIAASLSKDQKFVKEFQKQAVTG